MTDQHDDNQGQPALGQPPGHPDPSMDADSDFSNEHQDTAVDDDILTGEDSDDREPESPEGWSGMER